MHTNCGRCQVMLKYVFNNYYGRCWECPVCKTLVLEDGSIVHYSNRIYKKDKYNEIN